MATTPVELYEVVYGDAADAIALLTNAPVAVPVDDGGTTHEYKAIPVSRSAAKEDGALGITDMTITVPLGSDLGTLFSGYPPSRVVALVLRRGEVDLTAAGPHPLADFTPEWTGTVTEVTRTRPGEMGLVCKPPLSALDVPGLRAQYQHSCGHVLYGPRCQADKAAGTTTAAAASVAGFEVTFADTSWMKAGVTATDYIGGWVEWTSDQGTEFASILDATDTTIILAGSMRQVIAGTSLTIRLSCPRTLEACLRLHDNILNYGGFPWIPTENPVLKNTHD